MGGLIWLNCRSTLCARLRSHQPQDGPLQAYGTEAEIEGFGIRTSAHGAIEFTDPSGALIPSGAETRCRGNVFSLVTVHEQLGIHITPDTAVPDWFGERMDDQLAVEAMLSLE